MDRNNIRPLARFLVSGGSSTAIDYVVYRLLIDSWGSMLAKLLSTFVAVVYSFFLNKTWTFQFSGKTSFSLVFKYAGSQGLNILVNATVNYVVLKATGNIHFAFLCATACGMIVNFLLQRYVVFPNKATVGKD